MARTTIRNPTPHDGYTWTSGQLGAPQPNYTLIDPDGEAVAYVYPVRGTWSAIWFDGDPIAESLADRDAAVSAADNAVRPCAYVPRRRTEDDAPCDAERAPESHYCPRHTR